MRGPLSTRQKTLQHKEKDLRLLQVGGMRAIRQDAQLGLRQAAPEAERLCPIQTACSTNETQRIIIAKQLIEQNKI